MSDATNREGACGDLFSQAAVTWRLVLALLLSLICPAAWAQFPAGAEFQANTYTTNRQYRSAVASDANGGFVVVWASVGQDGSNGGVFGQRFNGSGVPQGSEFQVNSHTTSIQMWPAVASDPNGNFVVVWESYSQDGALAWGVFGQRFDAAGLPQGSEFQVNSYIMRNRRPAVASDANGNFVVVWGSYRQDASFTWGVFGQRFDAAGLPQGSDFQVNSYTTSHQRYPTVASDAGGNFVVVWQSDGQDGSTWGVFGQRFNTDGLPQGGEFQVNTYTTNKQSYPAVASDPNGNFVVIWESYSQDGSPTWGVFGQRFNAAGIPQGNEFQVNSYTTGIQRFPAAASDAAGNFVVVWQSYRQDGSHYGVFGQRFNASGVRQGSEFQVNSYTTGGQQYGAVGASPNGNFVVVWQSNGQDGWAEGIFGQLFGDLIFTNGFERPEHGSRVTDNDVVEPYGQGTGRGYGLYVPGTEAFILGNRINAATHGIDFSLGVTGKYKDNLTSGVTTPFSGGTNAGGNN